ncbi:MAG: DUF308 domain-containing protein [Bacteroidales bacterium]|nr:DUF308 domain-containing protein [Bacteroidales bacterium]
MKMFTFGYGSKISGPLRALIALAIGVMMVLRPENALTTVVKVIAAFVLASGLVSLIVGLKNRKDGSLPLMSFNAVVDIIIGLVLFSFPGFVARFIIYLIGFVLLGFGIMQILALVSAKRVMGLGLGAFILPIAVTLVGGFLLFNPFAESVMVMIAGAAIIVYGASELFSSWKVKKAIDEYEIHQAPAQEQPSMPENTLDNIKDVEYEKVDEQ